jgi:hypothetical protein
MKIVIRIPAPPPTKDHGSKKGKGSYKRNPKHRRRRVFSEDVRIRFWNKVDTSGAGECWPWLGAKKPGGYGNVRIDGTYLVAHRVAFEIATNIKIPQGLVAMHLCDNPSCCNPAHLVLGTQKANVGDMLLKCREYRAGIARGVRNGNAKLTEAEASEIRGLCKEGLSQSHVGKQFGVSQTTISNIINNKTWRS